MSPQPDDKKRKVLDLDSDLSFPDEMSDLVLPLMSDSSKPEKRGEDVVKQFTARRSKEMALVISCILLFIIGELCTWQLKLGIAWMFISFGVPYAIWILVSYNTFRCPKCNTWMVKFREGEGGILWKIKNQSCGECRARLLK